MSETRPSDSCRICKFSFKVKFGNVSGKQFYSSSQNLFKPSQRKDSFGIVLADVCKQVGLVLLEDSQEYSDRVCNPCGRTILTLGNLFEIVKREPVDKHLRPLFRPLVIILTNICQ